MDILPMQKLTNFPCTGWYIVSNKEIQEIKIIEVSIIDQYFLEKTTPYMKEKHQLKFKYSNYLWGFDVDEERTRTHIEKYKDKTFRIDRSKIAINEEEFTNNLIKAIKVYQEGVKFSHNLTKTYLDLWIKKVQSASDQVKSYNNKLYESIQLNVLDIKGLIFK